VLPQALYNLRSAHVPKGKAGQWRSRSDLGEVRNNKPFDDTVPGRDPELHGLARAGFLEIRQALQVRAHLPRQFHPLLGNLDLLAFSSGQLGTEKLLQFPQLPAVEALLGRTATRNSRRFSRPDVQLAQQINVGTNAPPGELIVDAKLMEQLTTGYTALHDQEH
jgi:hypothetical protein